MGKAGPSEANKIRIASALECKVHDLFSYPEDLPRHEREKRNGR